MPAVAHPAPLVSTSWVAEHLDDPTVRLVEVDLDPEDAYPIGHVPGAVLWTVWGDLLAEDERLVDDPAALAGLLSRSGITPEATVVLYGDLWHWDATLAFWVFHALGHRDIRVMDGSRDKWLAEGRPTEADAPAVASTDYPVDVPGWGARARRDDVLAAVGSSQTTILDVRMAEEYGGELFRPGAAPEAVHVPWKTSVNDDGTFEPADELRSLYLARASLPSVR